MNNVSHSGTAPDRLFKSFGIKNIVFCAKTGPSPFNGLHKYSFATASFSLSSFIKVTKKDEFKAAPLCKMPNKKINYCASYGYIRI